MPAATRGGGGGVLLVVLLLVLLVEGGLGWVRPRLTPPRVLHPDRRSSPMEQRRPRSSAALSFFALVSPSMTTGAETSSSPAAPSSSSSTSAPPPPAPSMATAVTVRQGFADFRSDTVTQPTQQMRKAMSKAEVGDDVFREDPTVDQLEREVAALLGHEAALFVPSRTMGNLISIMIWCSSRGSSFICGEKSHVFLCEEGGAAQFGGVSPFPVPHNEADGSLSLESIRQAILEENTDASLAQLITLESPVDRCGGRVLSVEYIEAMAALAHEHGLKLHLDGSRIWNAAVAAGVEVKEMAKHADSVTVCLSKGLGAPAGSLLVGSRAFTEKARKIRKALGGAMRQVGVLAAAGLVALKRTLPRLAEDHENAKKLAAGLAVLPGLKVNVAAVETNIVMVDLDERLPLSPQELLEELEKKGVLALAVGPRRLRMVTHYDVSESDVKKALGAFDKVLAPYKEALQRPPPPPPVAAATVDETVLQAAGAALDAVPPSIVDTTATTVVNNTAPAASASAAATKVEEKLVDVVVQGVSTSEQGFVVVLAEKEEPVPVAGEDGAMVARKKKAIKVVITPSDPMSAGLDVHSAETPEAVTLLQLLQDIDVGSYLKHDALSTLVGVRAGHPVSLNRVVLEHLSQDSKRFKARLEVDVGEAELTPEQSQQFKNDTTASADGMPLPGSAAPTRVVVAEVKTPFQAMALAFRYDAQLAASASILEDAAVAVDAAEVRGMFPDLLELKPGTMKQSPTAVASALDLDAEMEIIRLEKSLQLAVAAGDQQAITKLRKQLALYAPDLQELTDSMPLLEQGGVPSFYAQAAQGEVQQQGQPQPQQQCQSQPQRRSSVNAPYIPPPPADLIDSQ